MNLATLSRGFPKLRAFALSFLALTVTQAPSRADVFNLWATSVPETSVPASTTPWTNESYAAGAPTCTNCNTSSCQYSTNAVSGNTTPLTAVDFANFTLPANHRITRVQVEAPMRYDANTTANVGFRAFAPNHGLDTGWRNSPSFNSIAVGGVYVCADRLGSMGDITGLDANWTAAKVNNLQLQLRRQTGLTNNTLRVLGMRLVVTTQLATSAPATPNNLRATSTTANSIALAWNDNASNETGYVLYQLNPGLDPAVPGNWSTTNLAANATTATRTGLAPNSTYRFYVRAINAVGLSNASNMLMAATLAPPAAGSRFFFNEFYMTGGGTNYIEVAAPAGTVLDASYSVLFYNSNGQQTDRKFFGAQTSGYPQAPNLGGGLGVVRLTGGLSGTIRRAYAFVRVVGTQVEVLDFVTHRGSSSSTAPITAVDGLIAGTTSTTIPGSLAGSENTLKLIGSGCGRNHFQWAIPGIDYTPAAVNIGQAFTTCP
ncbi:MAG: hypothetical protein RLY72_231 [Planctomycetota bacterium]|jgi:hypothetical protein